MTAEAKELLTVLLHRALLEAGVLNSLKDDANPFLKSMAETVLKNFTTALGELRKDPELSFCFDEAAKRLTADIDGALKTVEAVRNAQADFSK